MEIRRVQELREEGLLEEDRYLVEINLGDLETLTGDHHESCTSSYSNCETIRQPGQSTGNCIYNYLENRHVFYILTNKILVLTSER